MPHSRPERASMKPLLLFLAALPGLAAESLPKATPQEAFLEKPK